MSSITETVELYKEKIEQNKISIKSLQREIDELESIIFDSTSGLVNELLINESIINNELTNIKLSHPMSTSSIIWKTFYNANGTFPTIPPTGYTSYNNPVVYGWNSGTYHWPSIDDVSRMNHVDKWAIGTIIPGGEQDPDVYNVITNYADNLDNTALVEATANWNLIFEQIVKPPGTNGAYGLLSQIESKNFAINFLTNENTFMNTYVNNFG